MSRTHRCWCGASSAFVLDTSLDKIVCWQHRRWQCKGCGAEHKHTELNTYSDDFEHWVSCPTTGTILQMDFWDDVATLPQGTTSEELCWECYGRGRCQCVGELLGAHERCLRCDGSNRVCAYCRGTGLKAKPAPPG